MELTELEKDVIVAITENEFSNIPGDPVWSWSIADNAKITKTEQISGVVSSLVKKGLVETNDESGDNSTVELTEEGVREYRKIKEG